MVKYINENYIKQIFETDTDYTEWFGYYNYDVISRDGDKMLCNRADFEGRAITEQDRIDLGWYDLKSGEWHYIDTSDSFNWQQGAMLQWLPGDGNENKVIYNISRDNHFKSVISDIETGEKQYIDFPTYCVTPDGRYSIALNYERSYWCRAYHYQSVKNPQYDVAVAEDDGIFKVDLERNTVERIIKIQDVIAIDALDDFKDAKHWLEHIMLDESGKHIAFLHRFSYGEGYITRICISDINGNNLQVCEGWKNNTWSHLGWKSGDAFAIYSVERSAIGAAYAMQTQKTEQRKTLLVGAIQFAKKFIPESIKRRLQDRKQYYELFELRQGVYTYVDKYDHELFDLDGHPSFVQNGKYLITDTYPDEKGYQRLIVMNTENRQAIQIANILASLRGTPASCDLHPKVSFGGKYVVVDSAYTGKHRMLVFELQWDEIYKVIG